MDAADWPHRASLPSLSLTRRALLALALGGFGIGTGEFVTQLITIALVLAVGNFASAAMPGFTSLLALRFLTGLPHGAYFGVASVLAGNLVSAQKRSSAMAVVFAGLTMANVIGVPLMTLVGQHSSWRICYLLVGAVEVLAAGCVAAVVPIGRVDAAGNAARC